MDKSDILQKIPYDQEFTYLETKECYADELKKYKSYGTSVKGCVNWLFENNSASMDENGMEKLVIMMVSMFFQIENDEVISDIAYGVKWDILDFLTGDYDELFTKEDLRQIKADVEILNNYFDKIPGLITHVAEDRRIAQSI